MSQRIESVGNILAEILNFLLAVAAMTLILTGFFGYRPGILRMCLLVFVPLFYYLVRRFCNKALVFFLLHFLAVAGIMTLYSRQTLEIVVFGFFSILFALFSIVVRLSEKKTGMSPMNLPAAAGFFFVIYLIDILQAGGVCGSSIMQLMIIYMIIYFLYYYLVNFDLYIDLSNRTTENISSGRAFGASFGLVAGFIGILGSITFLFADRQLADRIGSAIRYFLKIVLVFLFTLFPEGDQGEEILISEGIENTDMPQMIGAAENTEPSLFWQFLTGVLYVLVIIMIAVLAAAAVIGIIRFIKSVFGKRMQKKTVEEPEENDKVESLFLTKKKKAEVKRERFPGFGRTPDESIRRQYFKTLCKKYGFLKEEKTEKLILQGTAKECCAALFPDREKEAAEFSALYEKARYSADICDREEVRKMKRLAQQLFK